MRNELAYRIQSVYLELKKKLQKALEKFVVAQTLISSFNVYGNDVLKWSTISTCFSKIGPNCFMSLSVYLAHNFFHLS